MRRRAGEPGLTYLFVAGRHAPYCCRLPLISPRHKIANLCSRTGFPACCVVSYGIQVLREVKFLSLLVTGA